MTQYTPRALTDDEVGEGLWTLWNGLIPAYLSGQAGTNVPAGVGKGFVYTKLDGDGNILGAYFADGLGGESPVSPAHILWGVTEAGEARSALGIDAAIAARQVGDPVGVTSPVRSAGVTYQNTWDRMRVVAIRRSGSDTTATPFDFSLGPTAGALEQVGWTAVDSSSASAFRFNPQGPFPVPPGWFYRFVGAFDFWKEY